MGTQFANHANLSSTSAVLTVKTDGAEDCIAVRLHVQNQRVCLNVCKIMTRVTSCLAMLSKLQHSCIPAAQQLANVVVN